VNRTAIVTDSTAYLPAEILAAKGITVVSLYVNLPDGTTHREQGLDFGAFYDRLVHDQELPTTSPPAVEDFVKAYEPLLAEGRNVVSVHISSGISETCNVARQAAARLNDRGEGRVEVVDSAAGAVPFSMLVLAAAAGASHGEDVDAVIRRLDDARQTLKNRFFVDTLEFLRRGGRVGGAAAWLGSRLQVKPILSIEGEIRAVERVRTTERAFERLVDFAHRLQAGGAGAWAVQHARDGEACEELAARCQKVFRCPPLLVSEIGPVLGVHTGPGMLGVAGIDPTYLE
jgi:DegV family protein with EDD domain